MTIISARPEANFYFNNLPFLKSCNIRSQSAVVLTLDLPAKDNTIYVIKLWKTLEELWIQSEF